LFGSFVGLLGVLLVLTDPRGELGGVDRYRRLDLHLSVAHLLVEDVEEALAQISGLEQVEQ